MKSLNTPIIKFTLVLVAGVLAGFYLTASVGTAVLLLFSLFTGFVIAYFRVRRQLFPDQIFGAVTLLLFFGIGFFTTTIHLSKNQPNHYLQLYSKESSSGNTPVVEMEIREELKQDLYHHKFIAKVRSVSAKRSHGKILLLFPKDSSLPTPNVGNRFLIATDLKELPKPLNPHQFDYHKFMTIRGVTGQVIMKEKYFKKLPPKKGIFATAAAWRKQITENLKKDGFKPEELAIVQALLLGQKQDISVETYENYAAAGAIHILAISGLHVGILLLLLNRLFSPILRFKKGKVIRTFLILVILWSFAILAGLSPSVVRAVTMFSFLAIAMEFNRRTSSLNSLFLSLLLLLLIRPQWIFEVGFQLSYAAVLAIILLQPVLYKLLSTSNRVVKFFWGILTTTIAAQAGVLPLSLFYFHQFPGLFFVSNLVILPFLGFILGAGIIIILLSVSDFSHSLLTEGFGKVIAALNSFVATVARQEQFLFKDISFGLPEVWGWYLVLIFLLVSVYEVNYRRIITLLFSVVLLQSLYLYKGTTIEKENLIVFHRSKNSIIAKQQQHKLTVHQNREDLENKMIRNFVIGEDIKNLEYASYRNIHTVKGEMLMVIDSTGVYLDSQHTDYLLLTGSPAVNLERVIKRLQPKVIIADGSNYSSRITQWKNTAEQLETPFHYTGEKGALRIPPEKF